MVADLDGGALMDVGCYCISGARLLAGEPERVFGEQVVGPTGVDVDFYGVMRFPNDVVAVFDASFTLPKRQRLEAVGEEGTLVIEAPWRSDWGGRVLVDDEPVAVPAANPYELELTNLAAAIAGEAEQLLGRDDAVAQARVIEALYRSAESGEAVASDAGGAGGGARRDRLRQPDARAGRRRRGRGRARARGVARARGARGQRRGGRHRAAERGRRRAGQRRRPHTAPQRAPRHGRAARAGRRPRRRGSRAAASTAAAPTT